MLRQVVALAALLVAGEPFDARDYGSDRSLDDAFRGHVTFQRRQTGSRVFDLSTDGVAHHGLVADLLADVQRRPGGRRALTLLFHSAEAYLDMWRRTGA